MTKFRVNQTETSLENQINSDEINLSFVEKSGQLLQGWPQKHC